MESSSLDQNGVPSQLGAEDKGKAAFGWYSKINKFLDYVNKINSHLFHLTQKK